MLEVENPKLLSKTELSQIEPLQVLLVEDIEKNEKEDSDAPSSTEQPSHSENEELESEVHNLGKLKKTLGRKCPECNHPLQVRSYISDCIEEGETATKTEDYIICVNCGYEEDVEPKRKRRKERKNDRSAEEEFDGRNKKRNPTPRNNARYSRENDRKRK